MRYWVEVALEAFLITELYILIFNTIFRGSIPISKKLNPLFWFGNMQDPISDPNRNQDRWPTNPLWLRKIRWAIFNPLENFNRYCIGFMDKDCLGTDNLPEGRNHAILYPRPGERLNVNPPLISWRVPIGKRNWEGMIGWKPGGGFSLTFRTKKVR